MFEAHLPTADLSASTDHPPLFQSGDERLIELPLYNKKHLCHTWVWTAKGKRKDQRGIPHDRLFVYVEYKNSKNTSCYLSKELKGESLIDQQFITLLAESLHLPDINASSTQRWIDQKMFK